MLYIHNSLPIVKIVSCVEISLPTKVRCQKIFLSFHNMLKCKLTTLFTLFTLVQIFIRSRSVPPEMRHSSSHLQTPDWIADDEVTRNQNAFVTREITSRKGEPETCYPGVATPQDILQHPDGMFSLLFSD